MAVTTVEGAETKALDTKGARTDAMSKAQGSPQELSDCRSEVIALPPEFAPKMPKGGELLWFAPGMFDAESPGYFRYAFRLDFERPQPNTLASLEELLLLYYEGLMSAVAEGKKRKHPAGATRVSVVASDLSKFSQGCKAEGCVNPGQFFDATIETVDEFSTQKPITLKLLITANPSTLVASVLPAAKWRGESVVFGQGQGPAERHLLPLGCAARQPADAP